jgi:hypothetical protein
MSKHISHWSLGRPNEIRRKVKLGDTVWWHGAARLGLIVGISCAYGRPVYTVRALTASGRLKDYTMPRGEFERVHSFYGRVGFTSVEPDYRVIHARSIGNPSFDVDGGGMRFEIRHDGAGRAIRVAQRAGNWLTILWSITDIDPPCDLARYGLYLANQTLLCKEV